MMNESDGGRIDGKRRRSVRVLVDGDDDGRWRWDLVVCASERLRVWNECVLIYICEEMDFFCCIGKRKSKLKCYASGCSNYEARLKFTRNTNEKHIVIFFILFFLLFIYLFFINFLVSMYQLILQNSIPHNPNQF